MDDDEAAVIKLELLLLEPDVRNEPEQVRRRLHRDFLEHGASGRVWDRESVAAATSGTTERTVAADVRVTRLGPDAVLVTYVSTSAGRRALRSSTWVRDGASWLLLFHQGTPVES